MGIVFLGVGIIPFLAVLVAIVPAAVQISGLLGVGLGLLGGVVGLAVSGVIGASDPGDTAAEFGFYGTLAFAAASWFSLDRGLASPLLSTALILVPTTAFLAVMALRTRSLAALPTDHAVARALATSRGLELGLKDLPERADALEALGRAFPTTSGAKRDRALRLIAEARDQGLEAAKDLVAEAFGDLDRGDRTIVVEAAWSLGHPDLIDLLRGVEGGVDAMALLQARAACGDLDTLDHVPELDVEDAEDLSRAAGPGAGHRAVAELAKDPSSADSVRWLAVLRVLPCSEEAYGITAAYAAPGRSSEVRAAALRALGSLAPQRALPLAEQAMEDADHSVRFAARLIVGKAG